MSLSKEEQFWHAAGAGDLDIVKKLSSDPTLDVNWIGLERGDIPLHRACRFGHLLVVEFLLKLENIDVNDENERGASPFYLACQEGHTEVVSLLLADARIDIHHPNSNGATPFFMACQQCHANVVSLLLADERIDVNRPRNDGGTPFNFSCGNGYKEVVSLLLADERIDVKKPNNNMSSPIWFASQNGHISLVQLMLASGREIDTKTKSIGGTAPWSNKSAAEVARHQAARARTIWETEVEYLTCKQNGPLIADLLDSYAIDPVTTRQQLRELPELRNTFTSDLFALIVFFCDGLLRVNAASSDIFSTSTKAARFIRVAQDLPIELQMVLCHRAFGSTRQNIPSADSEPAFKKLGRLLARED